MHIYYKCLYYNLCIKSALYIFLYLCKGKLCITLATNSHEIALEQTQITNSNKLRAAHPSGSKMCPSLPQIANQIRHPLLAFRPIQVKVRVPCVRPFPAARVLAWTDLFVSYFQSSTTFHTQSPDYSSSPYFPMSTLFPPFSPACWISDRGQLEVG